MQLISPYGNRQPKQLWFQPWPHLSPQSFLRTIPCGCLHLKLTKCIKNNTFKCLSAEYFQHKSTKVKLETHELAPPAVNMLPTIKSNVDRLSWVVPDQHYLCPLSSCKWWSGNVKIPSTCTQVAPVISSSAVSMPPPPHKHPSSGPWGSHCSPLQWLVCQQTWSNCSWPPEISGHMPRIKKVWWKADNWQVLMM